MMILRGIAMSFGIFKKLFRRRQRRVHSHGVTVFIIGGIVGFTTTGHG